MLLKNEEGSLPLPAGSKISVLGKNADRLYRSSARITNALVGEGFGVNPVLRSFYSDASRSGEGFRISDFSDGLMPSGKPTGETPASMYDETVISSFEEYNDAAVIVVSRTGGEGTDIPRTMQCRDESATDMDNFLYWGDDAVPIKGARSKDDHYLLLDIEMPDVDGMALAAQVRRTDTSVSIVFVTNMAQYAIRGYEVDASDFIVKPVSYGDFSLKVGRIFRRLRSRGESQLTVNDGDTVKRIAVADIRYAEVSGHTLTFHMRDCVVAGRGALKKYENALLAAGFARCSNYCIVNLRCVTGMSGHTVFVSGADGSREPEGLAISHPRKKDFVRILNEFWRDNI